MINLEAVTVFQQKHLESDIMGVIRTMYPNVEIILAKQKEAQK